MSRRKSLALLALLGVSGAAAYWAWTDRRALQERPASQLPESGTVSAQAPPAVPAGRQEAKETAQTDEDKARRLILGVWQDEYKGKRTMTLNEDGTGTMRVELSGAQAILFASELHFRMKWSLDGKKLTKTTVGGEPAGKVNLILKTMGDTATDTILESTEDRLLLLDKDGQTKYDWRRPKEEPDES